MLKRSRWQVHRVVLSAMAIHPSGHSSVAISASINLLMGFSSWTEKFIGTDCIFDRLWDHALITPGIVNFLLCFVLSFYASLT